MTVPTQGGPRPITHRSIRLLAAAIAALVALAAPAAVSAATFDPLHIISDENWRDYSSMTQADVQMFLDAQAGVLKGYSCPEGGPLGAHSQVVKPASQIVWEASQYWHVSPKLVLATLEKEQSLISGTWHAGTYNGPYPMPAGTTHGTGYHLTNAMGAGCFPGSTDTHPGFGDQVWTGTQKLGQTDGPYAWYPGKQKYVHSYPDSAAAGPGSDIHIWITPVNQPTWNFYTYTPYYPQQSIWTIYVRYFGDPLAPLFPPGTVFRFYNVKAGSHFYTSSESERYRVMAFFASTYRYEGVAYSVNASNTANSAPLYRFCNVAKGTHFYTASEAEKNDVIAKFPKIYRYEGPAYNVSLTAPAGSTPVYRFFNVRTGVHFYTASEAEKNDVVARYPSVYRFEGIAFYLAP